MAVSYVADATSGNSGSATTTSFATTLPAGWQAGDVAVLTAHVSGGSLTITTPDGWTPLPGVSWPVVEGSASRLYVWYRVLQGGDTAPTLTNSGSVTGGWECQAFRDAHPSAPIGQVGTSTASATSINLPSLTGVAAGSLLAGSVHARVGSGTIPSGIDTDAAYTETVDHGTSRPTTNANMRMNAVYRLIGAAGDYGGESFAVSNSVTSSMIAALVEIAAGVTQVSASTSTGWSVSATVAEDTASSWAVASQVSATVDTGWSVASTVTAPTVTGWSTASTVTAPTTTSWSTAGVVSTSTATGWDVAAQVAASTSTGWVVAAIVSAATATGWSVGAVSGTDTTTGWDVAVLVTTATSTGWQTVAQVEASATTDWSVDGAALPATARGTARIPPGSTITTASRSEVRVR